MDAHGRVNQWSNGTNAPTELTRMMEVRRVALARFGEQAIKKGEPFATIEEVLVPLYLHHRYQVDATASMIGGLYYGYGMRGDGREPVKFVPAAEQKAALDALLTTIDPSELALPAAVLKTIPPRPSGYGGSRELFPRYTGGMFDAITPAMVAADLTISAILTPARAARLVEQQALDKTMPGLHSVIDAILASTSGKPYANGYEAEIGRAVQRVVVDQLMNLAANAPMPQVRAIATAKLQQARTAASAVTANSPAGAHAQLIAADIKRFLERPATPATPITLPTRRPERRSASPRWIGYAASSRLHDVVAIG